LSAVEPMVVTARLRKGKARTFDQAPTDDPTISEGSFAVGLNPPRSNDRFWRSCAVPGTAGDDRKGVEDSSTHAATPD
jgi:hypothetical protein